MARMRIGLVAVLIAAAGCQSGATSGTYEATQGLATFSTPTPDTSTGAQLTYPADGATDVDLTSPFTWAAVSSATGYYLTVGTTVGGRDLVDTGQITATSYLVTSALPVGTELYVRLYTLLNGVWEPMDSTFTAAAMPIADLTNPTDGAQSVDLTKAFSWNAVAGASSYYLTIGSQPGARDIVDTGQLATTSYLVTQPIPAGVTLHATLYTLYNGTWRSSPDVGFTAAAQPIAQLTYPTAGQQAVDTTQPVAWSSVSGANGYYLTIGSTLGGRDLVDTGEISTTTYLLRATLPNNATLYARVYTLYGGTWRASNDVSFTAAAAPIAQFTYPSAGATIDGTTPFQWTAVSGASAYYLTIGTSIGARDVTDTGQITTTSYSVTSNLPTGVQLYARIYTLYGGVWRSADVAFTATATAAPLAHLDAPADGATGVDPLQSFQWTAVNGAEAYYVTVGTTLGARDVVDSGSTTNTQYVATNPLPAGITLYARLYTYANGVWRPSDSTFSVTSQTQTLASLTYPADGATNVDATQPFQWTTVSNATAYYLTIGSTLGARDLIDSGQTTNTQYLLPVSLPTGVVLYARLYTLLNGIWHPVDTTFTAGAPSQTNRAQLTYPTNGASNVDQTLPFQWNAVAGATAYYLTVGTTLRARDVIDSGQTSNTQYIAASTLPSGVTLYATLYSLSGGVWLAADTAFTAAPLPIAKFTSPLNQQAIDYSQPFSWTAVSGATAYYLTVGTTLGGRDIFDSGEITATSAAVPASFATGTTYYARVYTLYGGIWRSSDVAFLGAVAPVAAFVFPLDGASNVDLDNRSFEWNTVQGTGGYYLTVGTSRLGRDILDTGDISVNQFSAHGLPAATTLYATLYTLYDGVWRSTDITFTTAAELAADLTYPADGMINVDSTQPFQWNTIASATSYELTVGTTVGGNDLVDTGAITTTSFQITSALPNTATLYARVYTTAGGVTRYHDSAFRVTGAPLTIATMIYPVDGTTNVDGSQLFRWSTFDLAQGYRLEIGTTANTNDVYDSGLVHVDRRFVPSLPVGVPLFGRISTQVYGQWYSNTFGFTATSNASDGAAIRNAARWAIDYVRMMADFNGFPVSHTVLQDIVSGRLRTQATCLDYSDALREVLDELDITATHRNLTVCLDPNAYDCHTLVELQDPDTSRWLALDPTFDLAPHRASDGAWATADEVSAATQAMTWSDIGYDFLGAAGDSYARGYYLDYPLLFLNVYRTGQYTPGVGQSPLPLLQSVAMPVASTAQATYVVQSYSASPATVSADGSDQTLVYNGVANLSQGFTGQNLSVSAGDPSTVTVYRVPRYVF